MTIKRRAIGLVNYIKFAYFLCKGVFGNNSSDMILKVLCKFISLEAPFYSQKIVMGRSMPKSINLLENLVASYIQTRSTVTLDQILEVLKEEFIKREDKKYGRK